MKKLEAQKLLRKICENMEITAEVRRWIKHSHNVAIVAEKIARLSGLDDEKAYVMGLLHDIGRSQNPKIRHTILGYKILKENNLPEEISRIAITHLYLLKDGSNFTEQKLQFTQDELEFVENYIQNVEYDDYDKLIQIADLIGEERIKTIEERLFSVFCRYNINNTMGFCLKVKELKEYFESKIGSSIYEPFKKFMK